MEYGLWIFGFCVLELLTFDVVFCILYFVCCISGFVGFCIFNFVFLDSGFWSWYFWIFGLMEF